MTGARTLPAIRYGPEIPEMVPGYGPARVAGHGPARVAGYGPARVAGTLNIFVESLGRHPAPSSTDLDSALVKAP
jgi:hypothetical protein